MADTCIDLTSKNNKIKLGKDKTMKGPKKITL
jgi:hypothetical protein